MLQHQLLPTKQHDDEQQLELLPKRLLQPMQWSMPRLRHFRMACVGQGWFDLWQLLTDKGKSKKHRHQGCVEITGSNRLVGPRGMRELISAYSLDKRAPSLYVLDH